MTYLLLLILPWLAMAQDTRTHEGSSELAEVKGRLTRTMEIPRFGRIAYRPPVAGNHGPVVLLLHGLYAGVSHRVMINEMEYLDSKGFRVYIVDLPGIGKSDRPKRTYSIENLDDAIKLIQSYILRRPAHLVCREITCLSVLKYAVDRPQEVLSVVAINPPGVSRFQQAPSSRQAESYRAQMERSDLASWETLMHPTRLMDTYVRDEHATREEHNILAARLMVQAPNTDQRWMTYAIEHGQFFRSFETATKGMVRPALIIAQKLSRDESEVVDDFRLLRPQFSYAVREGTSRDVSRRFSLDDARDIEEFILSHRD